jgi:hypothetical protein
MALLSRQSNAALPDDVQDHIVRHMSFLELQRLQLVSVVFRRAALHARYSETCLNMAYPLLERLQQLE